MTFFPLLYPLLLALSTCPDKISQQSHEFVVGKRAKKEYPHLDKKNPSTREETHEWKRMSRYEGY